MGIFGCAPRSVWVGQGLFDCLGGVIPHGMASGNGFGVFCCIQSGFYEAPGSFSEADLARVLYSRILDF